MPRRRATSRKRAAAKVTILQGALAAAGSDSRQSQVRSTGSPRFAEEPGQKDMQVDDDGTTMEAATEPRQVGRQELDIQRGRASKRAADTDPEMSADTFAIDTDTKRQKIEKPASTYGEKGKKSAAGN
ncbi:unnamed protein product, partial [Prorocentrum cordatum]